MIWMYFQLNKLQMTDWIGWSLSCLNTMCAKMHWWGNALSGLSPGFFFSTFSCMPLHVLLLQHLFTWLLFPTIHSHIVVVFFHLFCDQRDIDVSCSRLSAVSTDTGFDRRRRRDPYEPREALHSLHSVYTSSFYSQVDFHTILGNVFPASNARMQTSLCYGLPSPRKKMRFFAMFWLRVWKNSAFFSVRWAQSFQNLGFFSDSVHNNKQIWLVWENVGE